MKKFTLCLSLLLAAVLALSAQQMNPSRAAAQRMFEEKLRGYDFDAVHKWMNDHPGEQLPGHLWESLSSSAAGERNADGVVSANAEAPSAGSPAATGPFGFCKIVGFLAEAAGACRRRPG